MRGWAGAIAVGLLVLSVGEVGAITPQTIEGELTADDPKASDGTHYDVYEFQGRAGEEVAIELESEDFDAYLMLNHNGDRVGENDDGGSLKNSLLVVKLPTDGTYRVLANTVKAGERGRYRLTWRNATQRDQQRAEAFRLNQQARQLYHRSQWREALPLFQQANELYRLARDRVGEGTTLNNIGSVYSNQGQYGLALDQFQQALAIRREVGDRAGEGTTLNNIGFAYNNQGQYGLALDQFQQALAIRREVGDRAGEGTTLNNIGFVYDDQGQYNLALDQYQKALAIHREVGDLASEGTTLNNIGSIYNNQGQYNLALEQYQQALKIAREVRDRVGEGTTINNIGFVYENQEQYDLALEQYQQALAIHREVGNRAGEGTTLNNIGNAYQLQGQHDQALEHYQQALAIHREVGSLAGEGTVLNNIGLFYIDADHLDLATSFLKQSLIVNEAIEREIGQQDLSRIEFFETRASTYAHLMQVLISQRKNDHALETADRARSRSLAEFLNLSMADQPQSSLSSNEMKQMAQDRNATILVYAIIRKEIYIWAVTPTGGIAFEKVDPEALGIPISAVADRARRAANFPLNDLAFSQDQYRLDLQATRGVGEYGLFAEDPEHLKRIYRLLIQPIEAHLPSDPGSRLLIIPHRELSTVPFAALLDESDRFLVDRYALSIAPSLQVLAAIGNRDRRPSGPPLVVGNPSPMPADDDGSPLDPLPGAEREAQVIATLLNTTPLLNRQATETTVSQRLETASILHFATHGILSEDARGVQDSWLALGPDGQNDGKLDLSEVFDSNLSAELAVLSACDTNRGQVTGEGVIGLGRAFLRAGTPTVVASLWKVPDEQTAMLMEGFYEELLAGRDRADALRLAQLKVREQYPNPHYWAAFVLIGEGDRPLDPS